MAKKQAAGAVTDNPVARFVKDSAHQVWLAGVGAYTRAGEEGGRLFDSLVSLGERIESGARARVDARVRAAESRVHDVRDTASVAWERFEALFQQRVARALNGLQIPTARDIHELNRRVEALQKAVDRLTAEAAGPGKPAASRRKAPARKPAARKARARTGASRKAKGRPEAAARSAG